MDGLGQQDTILASGDIWVFCSRLPDSDMDCRCKYLYLGVRFTSSIGNR